MHDVIPVTCSHQTVQRALLRPKGLVMTHIETIFGPHGPIQAYMGPARAATVRQNHFRNYIFPFFSFLNYISPMYLPTGSPQNICVTTMLTNADSLSPSEISSFFFSLDSAVSTTRCLGSKSCHLRQVTPPAPSADVKRYARKGAAGHF